MRVTEASVHRLHASFSAKFAPQRPAKRLSGLLKQHVAPYDSYSILRPRWNATSIACTRKCRSVHALRWTCGGKPKPKAVNKLSKHFMRRVQDENNPVSLLQSRYAFL